MKKEKINKPRFKKEGKYYTCTRIISRNRKRDTLIKFYFSDYGFNMLLRNFKLGNCFITEKGLFKYSDKTLDIL